LTKLESRIKQLLSENIVLEEGALEKEVALFADKCDISEEITRLNIHFKQAHNFCNSSDVVGRKFDFLVQEMNREINTIGSKANDAYIAKGVIDFKAELERLREQLQNIE